MHKVKVAIDGCGTLTSVTILGHLAQPDFRDLAEVVAVCDIVPERARAAAEAHGIPQWFGDYEEMLAKSDADAILIIVPHAIHADHSLKAIRSGRHVYVQKPMADNYEEGLRIVEESKAKGVKVVAAPGQTLWPMYHRIRDVIEQGEIGPVYWAMPPMMGWGSEHMRFPTNPSWFFGKDAGPFRDHGGYGFQSLVTLFGPALRISTMAGTGLSHRYWEDQNEKFEVKGPDNTVSLLDFGASRFGVMPECWCDTAPGVRFLRIHGLWGSIETDPETFNGLDILPIGATVRRMGKDPIRLEVPHESVDFTQGRHPWLGHTHVYGDILHLVKCILDDVPVVANAERGLHFVDCVESAFRSAETGSAVDLRPILSS